MEYFDRRFEEAVSIYNSGNFKKAELIFEEILKAEPNHEASIVYLAEINYRKRNLDRAIELLYKLIDINPTLPEVYNNLGVILKEKGRIEEAISCYIKAIHYGPDMSDSYYNLGIVLQEKGEFDSAIMCFKKAIELNPEMADYHINLAISLQKVKRYDDAMVSYEKAIELNPVNADYYYNLGTLYHEMEKIDEALSFYKKALELNSMHKDAYVNAGLAYAEKGMPEMAISYYDMAISLEPQFADAHWNKALSLLLLGRYEEGWREYEWRTKASEIITVKRNFPKPLWDGTKSYGTSILLYAEQGLGDTIQFIRYVPLIAEKGFNIIVEVQEEVKNISRYVDGVKHVISIRDEYPDFDAYYPLLSLPFLLNTTIDTIPLKIPYIKIGDDLIEKWRDKLGEHGKRLKVGLVWSGNTMFKKAHLKRCPIEKLLPLFENEDILFYSLQKYSQKDYKILDNIRLIDYMNEVEDFVDTAGIIMNLDLVISIDTAVAHLSGAMGKPVWVLIPYVPDWRWLLDREDSPWYPTMRLFRQSKPMVWDDVILKIKDELRRII
jgi:tetratricopeptide (TPR) repeat protein